MKLISKDASQQNSAHEIGVKTLKNTNIPEPFLSTTARPIITKVHLDYAEKITSTCCLDNQNFTTFHPSNTCRMLWVEDCKIYRIFHNFLLHFMMRYK